MELKTIENIIENLKTQGFKPTHQTVKNMIQKFVTNHRMSYSNTIQTFYPLI